MTRHAACVFAMALFCLQSGCSVTPGDEEDKSLQDGGAGVLEEIDGDVDGCIDGLWCDPWWCWPDPACEEPEPLASERELREVRRITGDISPKSVVHSGNGLFIAQNMMYRHTMTVYDRNYELLATISDSVDLFELGADLSGFDLSEDATYRGSPVEAAFSSDGRYAYVSNYNMNGPGFDHIGMDACNVNALPEPGRFAYDDSFVYRVDMSTLEVDAAIRVGSIPKFLAVTPDDSRLLVSNWCSASVSVVDLETLEEIGRVNVGRKPRGVAISPDGALAYVTVMGWTSIAVIDLETLLVVDRIEVGRNPRHVVFHPEGQSLYVTLNGEGVIIEVDVETGQELARVRTGSAPRSMDISADGSALYVVNYNSDTIAKVATETMAVQQTLPVPHHPIGITYDDGANHLWVASYSGVLTVFEDAVPEDVNED